tara:strand:+ start:31 stop:306 length:276 start_codon:yes stop_codon:yes gene_type:complete
MNWKNTPKGVKAKVEKADKKADKKVKSDGDPHGRTTKEKVVDFAKGVGLTSKQKTAREFIKGGLIGSMGTMAALGARAANVVKKAHAHKKE